jgi:hypothetical protein
VSAPMLAIGREIHTLAANVRDYKAILARAADPTRHRFKDLWRILRRDHTKARAGV